MFSLTLTALRTMQYCLIHIQKLIRNVIFDSSLNWSPSAFGQEISASLYGKGNEDMDLSKAISGVSGLCRYDKPPPSRTGVAKRPDRIESSEGTYVWNQQWLTCSHKSYEEASLKHGALLYPKKSGTRES